MPFLSCTGGFWRRQKRERRGQWEKQRALALTALPLSWRLGPTQCRPPAIRAGSQMGTGSRMIGPYEQGPTAQIWGSLNSRPPRFQIAPICCICSALPPNLSGAGRRPSCRPGAARLWQCDGHGFAGRPPSGAGGRVLAALGFTGSWSAGVRDSGFMRHTEPTSQSPLPRLSFLEPRGACVSPVCHPQRGALLMCPSHWCRPVSQAPPSLWEPHTWPCWSLLVSVGSAFFMQGHLLSWPD